MQAGSSSPRPYKHTVRIKDIFRGGWSIFKGDHSKMTTSGQFVMKYSGCCQRSFFPANLAVGSSFSTFDPLKLRCGIFVSFGDAVVLKLLFKGAPGWLKSVERATLGLRVVSSSLCRVWRLLKTKILKK